MKKLFSISTLIIIIFLASCDIPSQKVVIPEQLSYPAWLEGSWYEKNPEYILIHAEGGDITCPIANNQSLYVTAKSYNEYAKEFTETLTSNSYTLKLIVEKDEGQYFYREREYEFKKIGSSRFSVGLSSDIRDGDELNQREKVVLIPVSISNSLCDLDPVVEAFQLAS